MKTYKIVTMCNCESCTTTAKTRLGRAWTYLMQRWIDTDAAMDSWTIDRLAAICTLADSLKITPWSVL
jgi:hypothetical protein